MRIVISGIPIDVQKKNIKNMHLQVKPPDGHVVISAPLSVDDKAIEAYARTQLGFIKRAIAQFQDQPRASKRQYVSGETMYIWGKQYFLVFKPDNQKNSLEIQNQNIVLSMSAKSTVKQRDAYVKEEYRKILKEEIEKRYPGARILDIEYENRGRVEVEIRDGSIQKEVVFTSDNAGSYAWVQTSCDVRWKDIPKAVADTIENNRKGAEIDDVDFIETPSGNYYLVELEMHSADIYLKIDEQGTVLNA